MARSLAIVRTGARWLSGRLLVCGTLACSVTPAVLAGQQRQPPPGETPRYTPLRAREGTNVVRLLVDDARALPQYVEARLPANLVVPAALHETMRSMLRDSPTFRRQCARLANALLTISVEHPHFGRTTMSQATTTISVDRDGRIVADVLLDPAADRVEVIAHEFEHIIEQLDGVDLRELARHPSAGVRLTADVRGFETERAVAMGRQVAHEVRTGSRSRK